MKVGQKVAAVAENHYPDRLKHCYVVNAPGIFAKAWKLVKGWFSQQTQELTTIVSAKDTKSVLEGIIEPAQIPDFIYAKKGQVRYEGKPWSAFVNCPEGPCPKKFAAAWPAPAAEPASEGSNHVVGQYEDG